MSLLPTFPVLRGCDKFIALLLFWLLLQTELGAIHAAATSKTEAPNDAGSDPWKISRKLVNLEAKFDADLRKLEDRIEDKLNKRIGEMRTYIDGVTAMLNKDKNEGFAEPTAPPCGGVETVPYGYCGYIFYNVLESRSSCIWTIRVDKAAQIQIRLMPTYFGVRNESRLTVFEPRNLGTSWTLGRTGPSHNQVTVNGSIAFVTLSSGLNTSSRPSFTLQFEGIGYINDNISLSNYYLTEPSGGIKYPLVGLYRPNELATFVINPVNGSPFVDLSFLAIDIESHQTCNFDRVSAFYKTVKTDHYVRCGYANQNYNYCNNTLPYTFPVRCHNKEARTWILIFESDSTNQFTGFTVNWTSR